MQTALIDLGSSLSVTAPSIAKLSGATLVSGFNLHLQDYLKVQHDIIVDFFWNCSKSVWLPPLGSSSYSYYHL